MPTSGVNISDWVPSHCVQSYSSCIKRIVFTFSIFTCDFAFTETKYRVLRRSASAYVVYCTILCGNYDESSGHSYLLSYSCSHLIIRRFRLPRYGSCIFSVSGAATTNLLPTTVRDLSLPLSFSRNQLKSELLVGAYTATNCRSTFTIT